MNTSEVLRLERVSKQFKLYANPKTGPLQEILFFWNRKKLYTEFTAVGDVSLSIQRGEVVGIIGANGAGKSTLLKMIAGLLSVDSGTIDVQGKVTALLAQGVGFHPEFSGRDNIQYGGMLLGMSKEEVVRKMPQIIEFADLGEYIDQPFRTYSSGMKARLCFATSMSIDPEILIVDEALATGDSAFFFKSMQRIKELCRSGATILFVSHNLQQVKELCSRAIVMQKGRLIHDGDAQDAIHRYIESLYDQRGQSLAHYNNSGQPLTLAQGTGEILVTDIHFRVDEKKSETLVIGRSCELVIGYRSAVDLAEVILCVEVRSEKTPVTYAYVPAPDTLFDSAVPRGSYKIAVSKGAGRIVLRFDPLIMGDGLYYADLEFYSGSKDYTFWYETCFCHYERILKFQAVYQDSASGFGRGTITEIPVASVRIETDA